MSRTNGDFEKVGQDSVTLPVYIITCL